MRNIERNEFAGKPRHVSGRYLWESPAADTNRPLLFVVMIGMVLFGALPPLRRFSALRVLLPNVAEPATPNRAIWSWLESCAHRRRGHKKGTKKLSLHSLLSATLMWCRKEVSVVPRVFT